MKILFLIPDCDNKILFKIKSVFYRYRRRKELQQKSKLQKNNKVITEGTMPHFILIS